jgi:hypothetical protein
MSKNWIIAGVAAVCFVTGIALSHRIEPGVRVEKIMLTTNTPALRIFPASIPLRSSLMDAPARKRCCFVSAKRSPPLVLSAIPWIRRDTENRRSLAPSPTSTPMEA